MNARWVYVLSLRVYAGLCWEHRLFEGVHLIIDSLGALGVEATGADGTDDCISPLHSRG